MAIARQALYITRCFRCQSAALNGFLALASLNLPRSPSTRLGPSAYGNLRYYSPSKRKQADGGTFRHKPGFEEHTENEEKVDEQQQAQHSPEVEEQPPLNPWYRQNQDLEPEARTQEDENFVQDLRENGGIEEESPSTPWYLREQAPQQAPASMSEREQLPELPLNPPENLHTILEHLSRNIGLDYLTLLDMRELDPPPPLGANLIMLIGTARSEKHLHVSADRFCRWLRHTYKLTPGADGLLGCNELKRKLRRKAKRAKLLRSVHAPVATDTDDGISTSWVCVNAGFIDENTVHEKSLDAEGIVGFGTTTKGTRLVVQMMTEDKRQELDLEKLWNGYLRRQRRRDADMTRDVSLEVNLKDGSNEVGPARHNSPQQPFADSLSATRYHTQLPRLIQTSSQLRNFHSTAFRQTTIALSPKSEATSIVEPQLDATSVHAKSTAETRNWLGNSAEELLRELLGCSEEMVTSALGSGPRDVGSTEFLQRFHSSLPRTSDVAYWEQVFGLAIVGIKIRHPGYRASRIVELLEELEESGTAIPSGVLDSIITPAIRYAFSREALVTEEISAHRYLGRVLEVLQNLQLRGLSALSPRVCEELLLATVKVRLLVPGTAAMNPEAVWHLSRMLEVHNVHPRGPLVHARILEALATIGDWEEYRRYWRGIARRMERRPQLLYYQLFRALALTNHSRNCGEMLEEWIPEMDIEEPPVEMAAELAQAVISCLRVADPTIVEQADGRMNEHSQWVKLWRRCLEGLSKPPEEGQDVIPELDKVRAEFEGYLEHVRASRGTEAQSTVDTESPEEVLDDI